MKKQWLIVSVLAFGMLLPFLASAQEPTDNIFKIDFWAQGFNLPSVAGAEAVDDTLQFVINVINLVLNFTGLLSVAGIIFAGLLYLTAAGNTNRVDQAKTLLKNAVIGLVLVMISFTITNFVFILLADALGVFDVPPPPE